MYILCAKGNSEATETDHDRFVVVYKLSYAARRVEPSVVTCSTARNAMAYANGMEAAMRHMGYKGITITKTAEFDELLSKELENK